MGAPKIKPGDAGCKAKMLSIVLCGSYIATLSLLLGSNRETKSNRDGERPIVKFVQHRGRKKKKNVRGTYVDLLSKTGRDKPDVKREWKLN